MKHKPSNDHEYMKRIRLAVANGVIDKACVGLLDVCHDDWCNALTQEANKMCNCDPILTLRAGEETFQIMEDGFLVKEVS